MAITTIPNERLYKPFNMNGARYYTFKKGNVTFFALDSNYMDLKQRDWLENAIAIHHHALENLLLPSSTVFRRQVPRSGS